MRSAIKSYIFITLFFAFLLPILAISMPSALGAGTWTTVTGTSVNDVGNGIAIDVNGDFVFVVGKSHHGIGTNTSGAANTKFGGSDSFIAKHGTNTASLQWTELFGATETDVALDIATEATTSTMLYVTGYTQGTITSSATVGITNGSITTGNKSSDAYILKMDTSGVASAINIFGTTGDDKGHSVAVDATNGFVYTVGDTSGNIGSSTNAGAYDYFVSKSSLSNLSLSSGWPKSFGSTGDDRGRGIDVDAAGNLYVAGRTTGSLGDSGSNSGGYDAFVIKLSILGTKTWTTQIGTVGNDEARAVAVDPTNNVFITGCTQGALDTSTTTGNAGSEDAFVSKFNSSGVLQWTRLIGTIGNDCGNSIVVDSNSLFIAGYTEGSHGSVSNAGSFDAFISKYDPTSGAVQWTSLLGSPYRDVAYDVALDSSGGKVYVTGTVEGTPTAITISTAGGMYSLAEDYFVWKLSSADNILVSPSTGAFASNEVGTTTIETINFAVTSATGSNVAFADLTITGADNPEFTIGTDTCSNVATSSCGFSIRWTPLSVGTKTAFVSIPNNPSNSAVPTFSNHLVELSATATLVAPANPYAVITDPAGDSTIGSSSVTFKWKLGTVAADTWWLYVGTNPGGNEIFSGALSTTGTGTPTDKVVSTIPTSGKVYARIWTRATNITSWHFNDVSYNAASSSSSVSVSSGTAAVLTSGTSGTLSGSSHTFTWGSGTLASRYWLDIGNQGVGSWNLYGQSEGANLSRTVNGLPTDASTVYVRLWTQFTDNTWGSNDYVFTSAD